MGRGARFKFTMIMVWGFLLLGSVSSTRFVARAGLDHEPHSLRQTSLSARAYLAEQREANSSMANEVVVHLEPGTHFIRSALELGPSHFLPSIHDSSPSAEKAAVCVCSCPTATSVLVSICCIRPLPGAWTGHAECLKLDLWVLSKEIHARTVSPFIGRHPDAHFALCVFETALM